MKVYIVFIQNKVYQEIGNVYTNLQEAQKNCAFWRNELPMSDFGQLEAVIVEREIYDP